LKLLRPETIPALNKQKNWRLPWLLPANLLLILIAGCATNTPVATATQTNTQAPTSTLTLTNTVSPSPSATIQTSPTGTPTPVTFLCSPLSGITLAELPQLMNGDKYLPPLPSRDDGHHGIDFAFYRFGTLTTMLGLPIQAIFPGKVAAVINDRNPYGNAIIIEMSLDPILARWPDTIQLPTLEPTVMPDLRLTCPKPNSEPWLAANHRSLFYLYAHMKEPSPLKVGDPVTCGQIVGEVGTTGNSVNPHLHLETRLGPAGVAFTSMGYYDTRTTEEERSNYCTWRVSGWFQMIDPMIILSQTP
jgi:murein DD-endopeptidase MepM/ murein hydrolase activator NlpD